MTNEDTKLLEYVLKQNKIDARLIKSIIEELKERQEAAKEDKIPAVKKQYISIISDPEGKFEDENLTGWVVQIPEDESPYEAPEKLLRAAYEYNATKKGRKIPALTIGEVCESVPAAILKEQNIWVKTKGAITFLSIANQVPVEKTSKKIRAAE
ncbi:MAG: hypothetical protein LBS59_04090 [Puniceicoccales bacterium]|jgi:hypothetical protein|nr:hypothetical protein [Puniceicoccales bacterium]